MKLNKIGSLLFGLMVLVVSQSVGAACTIVGPALSVINAGESIQLTGKCAGAVDSVRWQLDQADATIPSFVSVAVDNANGPLVAGGTFTFNTPINLGSTQQHTFSVIGMNGTTPEPSGNVVHVVVTAPSLTVQVQGQGTGLVTSSPAPSVGNAISCTTATPCMTNGYSSGTLVTLTQKADTGMVFSGWGGDCTGMGSCSVTMSANHNVTASFSATPLTPQSISNFSANPSSITIGNSASLSATGGGSGNAVTFTNNTASICSLNGNSVTGVAAGNCTIYANQQGNSSYAAADQATLVVPVGLTAQNITNFSSNPSSLTVGGSGTLSATGGASGNAVTFTSNTASICSVSGNTVNGVAAGNCTIYANQLGNSRYAAAGQATLVVPVGLTAQNITNFSSNPSSLTVGGSGTLSATGGASGNAVTFTSNTASICSVSGNTVNGVAAGNCTIYANQLGGNGYAAAGQATLNINVTAVSTSNTDPGFGKGFWIPPNNPNVIVADQMSAAGLGTIDNLPGCLNQQKSRPTVFGDCSNNLSYTDTVYGTNSTATVILSPGSNILSIRFMSIANPTSRYSTFTLSGSNGGSLGGTANMWLSMDTPAPPMSSVSLKCQISGSQSLTIPTGSAYCPIVGNHKYYLNIQFTGTNCANGCTAALSEDGQNFLSTFP